VKSLATQSGAVETAAVRVGGDWRPDAIELASLAIAAILLFGVVVALLVS